MSKDSTSGGLLSKVVKFVRHPATNWGDLDTIADQRDQYSKQALKEMIERKRRNDFVRKREFDMLRRLRAKNGTPDAGQRGRPSFFQSSYNSKPDDRAGTLKKIDEIEAQMSMQWWKTKQRDSAGQTVQPTRSPGSTRMPQDSIGTTLAYGTTVPLGGDTEVNPSMLPPDAVAKRPAAADASSANGGGGAATRPMGAVAPAGAGRSAGTGAQTPERQGAAVPQGGRQVAAPALPVNKPTAPPTRPGLPASTFGMAMDAGPTRPPELADADGAAEFEASQFSASKFYAMDVAELAMDPEIEEAAIRFASGDETATEQGLLDVLSRKGPGGTADEWLALLDLYRATGQADRFENRALDFANRFSRSAPQWFSIPDQAAARVAKSAAVSSQTKAHWTAEGDMDGHMVTMMTRILERAAPPWVLDWSALQTIQPTAVTRLSRLFAGWAQSGLDLRFVGAEQLLHVLAALTPSGQRGVDQACWELRLAVLRVMNMPDEFELAALDFCVTYEISPPAWEPPQCHFRNLGLEKLGMAAPPEPVAPLSAPPSREFVHSTRAGLGGFDPQGTVSFNFQNLPQGELVGELLGDPGHTLQSLDNLMGDAVVRVVSCKFLIRVDFAAAGTILNWAAGHQAQGRRVRFVDVHRLISAFFHVIGITEHADVVPRED